LEARSWNSKEDDTRVEESLAEDQLAEIPIGNEQNAFLVPGDRKDILIGKTMRVVARDAFLVGSRFFFHISAIISYPGNWLRASRGKETIRLVTAPVLTNRAQPVARARGPKWMVATHADTLQFRFCSVPASIRFLDKPLVQGMGEPVVSITATHA
jgi:hypothetical protein